MNAQTTIMLKNRLDELERVAAAVAQFAAQQQLSKRVTFDVSLALDEILTNVIRYAYDGRTEHEICVHIACDGANVVVETQDDGRPFNPLDVAKPDLLSPLAERPVGGLGMHLVRSVMDDIEYARRDGKNILRMTKTLASAEPLAATTAAPQDLRIAESRANDGIVVLEVAGRLHGRNADALEQKLLGAITAGGSKIVLDVGAVDYFGSAGLRVLLVVAKRLRGVGAIALAAPRDFIRAVVDVAGLGSIVTMHADRAAAVAHLNAAV